MLCTWLVARLIRTPGPDSSGSILANGLGAQNTSGLEVTLGRLSLLRTNDLVTSTVLGRCTATVDRDYKGREILPMDGVNSAGVSELALG
jgi:hypothetical protein